LAKITSAPDRITERLIFQKPIRLFFQELDVSRDVAVALQQQSGAGLYFDWGPDSARYLPHVETPTPSPNVEDFLRIFGQTAPTE